MGCSCESDPIGKQIATPDLDDVVQLQEQQNSTEQIANLNCEV